MRRATRIPARSAGECIVSAETIEGDMGGGLNNKLASDRFA